MTTMKYVISDLGEINIGSGYHRDLAASFKGNVIAVGQCRKLPDGAYEVFGESYGYGIKAKPEDALALLNK